MYYFGGKGASGKGSAVNDERLDIGELVELAAFADGVISIAKISTTDVGMQFIIILMFCFSL